MERATQPSIPSENSWRVVEEGENESFDTAFRETFEEDTRSISSGQSQVASFSQVPDSQDSTRDFSDKADDAQVILRIPFQPSLAPRSRLSIDKEHTSASGFSTPNIGGNRDRFTRSPATEPNPVRRRVFRDEFITRGSSRQSTPTFFVRDDAPGSGGLAPRPSLTERFMTSVPEALFDCLAWTLSVIGMALHMMKSFVAFLLAIYVVMMILTLGKNRIIQVTSVAFRPMCRFPGVSYLELPFCIEEPPVPSLKPQERQPVEFKELMNVQSLIETVAEDSANKVSLPLEIKQTEASVRDLRTMVKYSELPVRDELVYEFDGYIEAVRQASRDLQSFNTQVESVLDTLISINRWTSRSLDSISANQHWLSRFLAPFQPGGSGESAILDKYIDHISLVSGEIEKLIVKAEATLSHLYRAENHVHSLQEHALRGKIMVNEERNQVFWDLWTLVGANTRRLHSLKGQLSLLRQVETQRHSATSQLTAALNNLAEMESKLSDLRDRVAKPELLADITSIPVRVHIDTINAALDRLVVVNSRSRAEAAERWKRALNWPRSDDHFIDAY
ncbi:hypothetical protein GGS21DRAFT_538168 [Xylaria nigripes]|nr:hypothetical protein GGS21DRAFT_538168 [Xylaria nigripes]